MLKKTAAKIAENLTIAESKFVQALRMLNDAVSDVRAAESRVLDAEQKTARMDGYVAAIYYISATPLLNAHEDVRREIVAELEHEMNLQCGEKPQSADAVGQP